MQNIYSIFTLEYSQPISKYQIIMAKQQQSHFVTGMIKELLSQNTNLQLNFSTNPQLDLFL